MYDSHVQLCAALVLSSFLPACTRMPAAHLPPSCLQDVLLEDTEGPAKTIVLITDGKPTDQPDALEAAAAARKRGIKMVVVGAGDIDYGGWASG